MLHNPSYRKFGYSFFIALALSAGCSASATHGDAASSKKFSHDTQSIANIAQSQVGCGGCGGGACSVYATSGGDSCNNPGEWCSDFAMWVWSQAGFSIEGLTPCSASYIQYGNNNGTMHTTPQVGDAIIWNYPNGQACAADHVELVYAVNADGSVDGISGNGGGGNGVVTHDPPCGALGECDSYTQGWSISAFVGPAGGNGGGSSGGGGPPPPPPSGGSGGGSNPCSGINDCTYCGNDNQGPGGDPNTLYQCSGGVLVGSTPCANGCQITPGDSCDVCN